MKMIPDFGTPRTPTEKAAHDWLVENLGQEGESIMKSLVQLIERHVTDGGRIVDGRGTEIIGPGPVCAACGLIPIPNCENPACAFRSHAQPMREA